MSDEITIADIPSRSAISLAVKRWAPESTLKTISRICDMVGTSSIRVIFVPKGAMLNGNVGGFTFYDAHCDKIFWVTDGLGVGMIVPLRSDEIGGIV